MKKTDNRGLSLIELLIAVCILAIIAAPLLHSFVTSYRVNGRGRQTMRATTLAQNEMEVFEREKISDIAANPEEYGFNLPADGILPIKPDANGCYRFEKTGVINDNSGRNMFDVYVTLDPERQADGKYEKWNVDEETARIHTLSVLDSGSYVQKVRTARNKKSDDRLVYEEFADEAELDGYTDANAAEKFMKSVERTIEVKIYTEPDGTGEDVTKAKVTYTYTYDNADNIFSETGPKEISKESIIFSNAQSVGEDGKKIPLKGVYLFYAPRYKAAENGIPDKIIIDNSEGIETNVYIIRQDILEADENWTETDLNKVAVVPAGYQPTLEIIDPKTDEDGDGIASCQATYYTNLMLDRMAETNPERPIGEEVQISINGELLPASPAGTDRMQQLQNLGCMKLGSAKARDRIYNMTVEVYEKNSDPDTEDPMITMRGTKLE